ncbi:SDR family NAD(P)-dependent oxidoreductase [Alkalihalobacillus sp. BA299]|uniref:SDR family NAD(P)-dependent oxidoreductase n=1 Tax=Alkalihalobacillus sp. BA299 TaxID=2815938 RepID=UPI001ADBB475|nr:glucose 1-dehydrogenase [Alkalihalobacillus sp. BA299]
MTKLSGKVAIVTGGASGIGEFTVREMVKEGASVVFADLNEDLGYKLMDKLNSNGKKVIFEKTDVTKEKEVEALVKRAVSEFEKLDIMVSNAGIGKIGPSEEESLEEWHKVLAVNLDGVFLSAKYAVKVMKNNGGGNIINVASILGHVGTPAVLSYTSSKGAVVNMTRALALEYAKDNIRVNAICPGYIYTPALRDSLSGEEIRQLVDLHPIGRLGEVQEVAKSIVFLASDDASFITGTSLMVDGGYTAQ